MDTQFITFLTAVTLLTLTPGADTMLLLRNVLGRGWQSGLMTILGISSGLIIHAFLSSLGLSVILARSAVAFEVVKLLGAAYLIFLGVQSIFFQKQPGYSALETTSADLPVTKQSTSPILSFREGFLTNILNPKVAIFYMAFLPQFINPGDVVMYKTLFLASIHISLGLVWMSIITVCLRWMREVITRPKVHRGLEVVSSVVLVALGIRLALEHR